RDPDLHVFVRTVTDLHRDPLPGEPGGRARGYPQLILGRRGVALEVHRLVRGEQETELLVAVGGRLVEHLGAIMLPGDAGDGQRGPAPGRGRRVAEPGRLLGGRHRLRVESGRLGRGRPLGGVRRGRGRGGGDGGGRTTPAHEDGDGDADGGRDDDGAKHQGERPPPPVGGGHVRSGCPRWGSGLAGPCPGPRPSPAWRRRWPPTGRAAGSSGRSPPRRAASPLWRAPTGRRAGPAPRRRLRGGNPLATRLPGCDTRTGIAGRPIVAHAQLSPDSVRGGTVMPGPCCPVGKAAFWSAMLAPLGSGPLR